MPNGRLTGERGRVHHQARIRRRRRVLDAAPSVSVLVLPCSLPLAGVCVRSALSRASVGKSEFLCSPNEHPSRLSTRLASARVCAPT